MERTIHATLAIASHPVVMAQREKRLQRPDLYAGRGAPSSPFGSHHPYPYPASSPAKLRSTLRLEGELTNRLPALHVVVILVILQLDFGQDPLGLALSVLGRVGIDASEGGPSHRLSVRPAE